MAWTGRKPVLLGRGERRHPRSGELRRVARRRRVLVGHWGEDWWRRPETGEFLRGLFREGHGDIPFSPRSVGAAEVVDLRDRPVPFSEPFWFAVAAFRPTVVLAGQ